MRLAEVASAFIVVSAAVSCSQPFRAGSESGTESDGSVGRAMLGEASSMGAGGVASTTDDAGTNSGGALGLRATGGTTPEAGVAAAYEAGPPPPSCVGRAGPKMVRVGASGDKAFCIDETEVTVSDFAAFLATNPNVALAPAGLCAFKTSFVPGGTWPSSDPDYPVTSVDWCDGAAYCAYAGKHLCGKVAGGPAGYGDFATPADEWFDACSANGTLTFPYGMTYDPSVCVGDDFDSSPGFQPATDALTPVGSATGCHGSGTLGTVMDMSGNAAEWEDACSGASGGADYCRVRGNSFRDGTASTMTCSAGPRLTRSARSVDLGFRCCMEP